MGTVASSDDEAPRRSTSTNSYHVEHEQIKILRKATKKNEFHVDYDVKLVTVPWTDTA